MRSEDQFPKQKPDGKESRDEAQAETGRSAPSKPRPSLSPAAIEARFLESILDNIPYMIFVKDAEELRFVRFNEAGERLLGYDRSRMIGLNDHDLFPAEEAEAFTAKDREVLANGGIAEISEEPIHTQALGRRTLRTKKLPLLDADGNPAYLLGISEDITEARAGETELRRVSETLAERTAELENAMGDLESMSYAIAHDLRSPLRAMDGYSHLVLNKPGLNLDQEDRDNLDRIRQAAHRMGVLVDGLLSLSRISRIELRVRRVDLSSAAEQLLHSLTAQDPEQPIDVEIEEDLHAFGDARLLEELLRQLLSNAWKFSRGSDGARISFTRGEALDGNAVFVVRDNGIGFDPRYATKLFSPFESLHAGDTQTGLGTGLATAERIVRRHGGTIWAEAAPNQGAAFSFSLPEPAAGDEGEPGVD